MRQFTWADIEEHFSKRNRVVLYISFTKALLHILQTNNYVFDSFANFPNRLKDAETIAIYNGKRYCLYSAEPRVFDTDDSIIGAFVGGSVCMECGSEFNMIKTLHEYSLYCPKCLK